MRLYFEMDEAEITPELPTHLAFDTDHQVYSKEIENKEEHLWITVDSMAMRILLFELDFCCFSYSKDLSAIDPAELEPAPF